jgi:hypothetical protein
MSSRRTHIGKDSHGDCGIGELRAGGPRPRDNTVAGICQFGMIPNAEGRSKHKIQSTQTHDWLHRGATV